IMPSTAYALISRVGWRYAYVLLGIGSLAVAIPVAIFLKETPGMIGDLPDGGRINQSEPGELLRNENQKSQVSGMTGAQALSSVTFWLLFAAVFLVAVSLIGCLIHMVPMLTDRGISPRGAAFATSLIGAAVIPGRVTSGYLVDRFRATTVA